MNPGHGRDIGNRETGRASEWTDRKGRSEETGRDIRAKLWRQ